MEPYLFYGKILPERAQITLAFDIGFSHLTSGRTGRAKISIILNELAVTVHVEEEWDINTLRNVIKSIVQSHLSMVGYLKGYTYDLEITRVLNSALRIDYVFGIDIPCIAKPRESIDVSAELNKLKAKTAGENGIFLNRCFNDLMSAMKYADDTGFYCYRALEALRHHCAAMHSLSAVSKAVQWEKFREVCEVDESSVRKIENAAKAVRHGEVIGITSQEREALFLATWDIVDSYLAKI